MSPFAKTTFVLATSLLAALAEAPRAQGVGNTLRSGYFDRTLGNEWLGGTIFAGSFFQAQRTRRDNYSVLTNNYAIGALNFDTTLRFLKEDITLAAASVSSKAANYGSTPNDASFRLLVRGVTERNQRFTTPGNHAVWSYYRTFDLFPEDPSETVWLGPVPVTLSGNVGVGVEANATLSTISDGYARIGGLGRAWGYGRIGVDVAYVFGAQLAATFANQRLTPGAIADARSVLTHGGPSVPSVFGQISYTIQPIALRIFVWVNYLFGRYERTLVNWASSTITIFNILI
jgi:hypothetical protein